MSSAESESGRPADPGTPAPSIRAVRYLDLEDLLTLTRNLGAGPVRDIGLLDSAAHRPQATVFGADAYPSISSKAAALLHSGVHNPSLVDGNKRLGWLATVVFLDLNGWQPSLDDDGAFDLVMAVASSVVDVDVIAEGLRLQPLPSDKQ